MEVKETETDILTISVFAAKVKMPESETDLRKLFQSSEELEEPEKSTIQGK